MSSAPASRRKPHTPALPDDTRTRLIDAAGQVFADFGFQAATVREICARAGVNVALVNYYFGDKLELYTEVLRYSIGSSKNGIVQEAIQSKAPPEEALRELILAMLQRVCRCDRPGWHFRLMIHEHAQPTPALSAVINETMRPLYNRFCQLIGAVIEQPPDEDQTKLCAHSVIAQVVHYVHSRHVMEQLWPELDMTPGRIAEIAAHIADFSLAYMRAIRPSRVSPVPRRRSPKTG